MLVFALPRTSPSVFFVVVAIAKGDRDAMK